MCREILSAQVRDGLGNAWPYFAIYAAGVPSVSGLHVILAISGSRHL
jgi:hypothetical protein